MVLICSALLACAGLLLQEAVSRQIAAAGSPARDRGTGAIPGDADADADGRGAGSGTRRGSDGGRDDEDDDSDEVTVSAGRDGSGSTDEFDADIGDAQQLAEAFWDERLPDYGQEFVPVSRVISYDGADDVECAGEPLGLNNAAYCPAGDFIAYDVNWAAEAFREVGDGFLFYLIGHEYAHGIQARLGIRKRFTIQQELQADCMAGAYIGDLERDGALVLQEEDLDELRRGLAAVGDEEGQPWFAPDSHGSPKQRTDSFFKGYEDSLDACNL